MTINIKYCGGCNPRYDRGAFAKRLQAKYARHRFVFNKKGEADILLVLYGCSAACADLSTCCGVFGKYYVTDSDQWEDLCKYLDEVAIF